MARRTLTQAETTARLIDQREWLAEGGSLSAWERSWGGDGYSVDEPDPQPEEGDEPPPSTAPHYAQQARPGGPMTTGDKIAMGVMIGGYVALLFGGFVVAPVLNKRIL